MQWEEYLAENQEGAVSELWWRGFVMGMVVGLVAGTLGWWLWLLTTRLAAGVVL